MVFELSGVALVVGLGFWLFCIVDVITSPPEEIRHLQKIVWLVLVLFFDVLAGVCWLIWGRPRRVAAVGRPAQGGQWSSKSQWLDRGQRGPGRAPRRVIAPDDDIDFLRGLNKPPE